jgi:hypothetical protein
MHIRPLGGGVVVVTAATQERRMQDVMTVGDVAQVLCSEHGADVTPRQVSDLLYRREIPIERCPIVGGRRLIPREMVPTILAALRRRGHDRAGART